MALPSLETLVKRFLAIQTEYATLEMISRDHPGDADFASTQDKVDALYASLQGLDPATVADPAYGAISRGVEVLQNNLLKMNADSVASSRIAITAAKALSRTTAYQNLHVAAHTGKSGIDATSVIVDDDFDDDGTQAVKRPHSLMTASAPGCAGNVRVSSSKKTHFEETTPGTPLRTHYGISTRTGEDGLPIYSFSVPEEKAGFGGSSEALLIKLASTDEATKKELKRVLQALSEIGGLHLLSSAAYATEKLVKHKVPDSWDIDTLSNMWTALSDVPLEDPLIEMPGMEGFEEQYKQIRWIVENLPPDTVGAFAASLRSIIIAAPYLIPSYAIMLATQAYHKMLPRKLSPILWNKEDPVVQLSRMLYFVHTPIVVAQIASLDPSTKMSMNVMLHSLLIGISGLSTEQRIFAATAAIRHATGNSEFEGTEENLILIYQSLKSMPVAYPDLPSPPCEGFDAMRAVVQASIQNLSVVQLWTLNNELQAILFVSHLISSDKLLALTDAALIRQGLEVPTWTTEDPSTQILRYFYFATSSTE